MSRLTVRVKPVYIALHWHCPPVRNATRVPKNPGKVNPVVFQSVNSAVTVIEIGTKTAVFSKTEPHRNCGFRLSIDGFGFLISNWPSSRVLTVRAARQASTLDAATSLPQVLYHQSSDSRWRHTMGVKGEGKACQI